MKAKKLSIFLVVLAMVGTNFVFASNSEKTFEIKEKFSKPLFHDNGEYIEIEVEEADASIAIPGQPMLPVRTYSMTFSLGTKIEDIRVVHLSTSERNIDKKVMPAPSPVAAGKEIFIGEDESIYGSDKAYPEKWFSYSLGGGIKDGEHVTFLNIYVYPVKYYPKENLIRYIENIEIEVRVQPAKNNFNNDEYDLLIIAPSEFVEELQPLVEHKNSVNISTMLVTLDQIPAKGNDLQEVIKYYIKDAIEKQGIKYVLLVGGKDKFPVRYAYVCYAYGNEIIDDEIFISDLYYADIYNADGSFSSWDTNGNGRYAEYNWENKGLYDDVDLYPDVYVGRLACNDENEVKTVVNKIINYEKMKAYSQIWFSNVVVIGGDTVLEDERGIDEGEYIGQKILETMKGFNGVEIWASNNKLASAGNINNAIEEGASFTSFSGHGTPTSWATHPHEKGSWLPIGGYKVSNVNALKNSDKLTIVVLNACSNSKFDDEPNCLGWAFLSNENGGGIGSFGNTALGWSYGGSYTIKGLCGLMELGTFKSYMKGAKTFGMLWGYTINNYLKEVGRMYALDYKTVEEWQPFGDPSLMIASPSLPPNKPSTPEGPTKGKKGEEYYFEAYATDPDGDMLYYLFDWGDGSYSEWLGPYKSGEKVNASHIWEERGEYEVRVKAKDIYGGQSEWSDALTIKITGRFSLELRFGIIEMLKEIIYRLLHLFLM